jgi:hypothetical protein
MIINAFQHLRASMVPEDIPDAVDDGNIVGNNYVTGWC